MNVCIINHSIPPYIGGAETMIHTTATEITRLGHNVTVICECPIRPEEYNKRYVYNIISVPGFRQFEAGRLTLREFLPTLQRSLVPKQFDVIHVHNFMPALAVAALSISCEIPIVFTFHSTPVPWESKILGHFSDFDLECSFAEFVLRALPYERLVCPSNYYSTWAHKLGASNQKVFRLYPPVLLSAIPKIDRHVLRRQMAFGAEDFVVLCTGRMIRRKGIGDLIQALDIQKAETVRCLIATSIDSGSPAYGDEVGKMIASSRYLREHVTIYSDKYDCTRIPELLAISDCMVLPSHVEGLGVSLIEAMVAGVPVIGCSVPGVREVITHWVDGLLVEPSNPTSLAEAIDLLRTNSILAHHLADEGKRTAKKRFSLRQVETLVAVYEDVIKGTVPSAA